MDIFSCQRNIYFISIILHRNIFFAELPVKSDTVTNAARYMARIVGYSIDFNLLHFTECRFFSVPGSLWHTILQGRRGLGGGERDI